MGELRGNITAYDAAYGAAAEAYRSTPVTADGRLSRAPALRRTVDVID